MGYWQKHTRKDDEAILAEFDQGGWVIEDPPKYYFLKCPCGEHYRWYHLTPSNPHYGKQALRWAKSFKCWQD